MIQGDSLGGCWGTGAEESQEPMRRLAVIQAMRVAVGFREMGWIWDIFWEQGQPNLLMDYKWRVSERKEGITEALGLYPEHLASGVFTN